MYELLLVTDKQPVLDAFAAIQNWEELGFRPPRIAGSAAEAMEAKQRQAAKSRNVASLLKTCSSWLGRFDAEAVEAARYVVWGANRATVLCTSTV